MADVKMETVPPAAAEEPAESKDMKNDDAPATPADPVKLPPCDQCRRRKVKCDGKKIPCERCTQSRLTCTRDIARKKRGPKKGSGSVIAKLRDEHEHTIQEAGLPPFDLSDMSMQMPNLHRSYSNESPLTSPLASPLGSQFGEYPPIPEPSMAPRSVPYNLQDGDGPSAGFAQGGIQFPTSSWQLPPSELLQFQAPSSPTGYMSVNDLAQQIFQDPPPTAVPPVSLGRPIQPGPPKIDASTITHPASEPQSIYAVLTSTAAPLSPTATTTAGSSPLPQYGPKYLYRTDSGNLQAEPRLVSLAMEVGMSAHLLSQCAKQYFRHVYAIRPFIHEPSFMARLGQPEELTMEEKVLILALCAVTAVHDSPDTDLSLEKKLQLGQQFLELAIKMRKNYDWIEHGTVAAIQTSYLICVALFELKKPKSHHFYIREAIGMAYDQGLHLESTYIGMTEVQAICARRTFAVLFITERGLAILRNKPAAITRLPVVPPEYFDDRDRIVLAGFTAIVSLFSVLDEKFIDLWRSTPGDETSRAPLENIAGIQRSLNEVTFDGNTLTPVQKADVYITRQWLRVIFWQASMRQGLVSSDATDPIFYYNYPILIAKDMCSDMNELTIEGIMVHGLGIFEKIFEIAYTLMDALTIAKLNWSESAELRCLFDCLAASPNSQNTYVKMLENKMDTAHSAVNSPDSSYS